MQESVYLNWRLSSFRGKYFCCFQCIPKTDDTCSELLKLVPSWVISTEKDTSVEKKWREWDNYDWW